ncbi:NAD-dependent epimerase/dehydratase family protein [Burkholderia thailandensis]|uniref:GDP-6-deoxy-D-lyxo-4-hexulose reductase, putative n=3 Tax=pseudomallei group TaxID=111527 RepID=Q2SYX0_BURTA|nr:NAD-dependent epimerase/dehydratase family protein [Burkholderia thailandensis]ABC37500.1 GDP-6-deoxy-D-lyxo-4-hexulose reductase, putative [Burkholderia thailandensis E264]AHI72414.1 3-beta hydroxysteroid dehydrogenase/isomerase family protein [Burkholderia thailandensis 2002721723]AHI78460.1 3-beta hydroxysteroid dehydrogenase/isomerase family protein [Burkholderia thailandensis E444]AIC87017.1 3-beta hydroxysteroid dehydrogenase/isomerase family protein [Burkholderia thailandensis USAMRU 
MAKVLITGIGGFTGRYLARRLTQSGHDVCGIVHRTGVELEWRAHVADLLDRGQLAEVFERERPDALVHLAAIAFVAHDDASAIYQTNVVGTRNLLDALASSSHAPRSVLLASSANVYGNTDREWIDESVPPAPANDYAVSKLSMEFVAKLWCDRLPIVVARPFNYTGVGQAANFLLPKIVSHFRSRAPVLELGNLDVIRDFSDVRAVAAAYEKLIGGAFAGETFNVCSGVGYSLQDVLAMAEELTGYRPEIRVNPNFVRANEVRKLIGNGAKLRDAIGEPLAIPLRDTLAWMLERTA